MLTGKILALAWSCWACASSPRDVVRPVAVVLKPAPASSAPPRVVEPGPALPVIDLGSPEGLSNVVFTLASEDGTRDFRFVRRFHGGTRTNIDREMETSSDAFARASEEGAPIGQGSRAQRTVPLGLLPGTLVTARKGDAGPWLHPALAGDGHPDAHGYLMLYLSSTHEGDASLFQSMLRAFRHDGRTPPIEDGLIAYRLGRFVVPVPKGLRVVWAQLGGENDELDVHFDQGQCSAVAETIGRGKPTRATRTSAGEGVIVDEFRLQRVALVQIDTQCLFVRHHCHAETLAHDAPPSVADCPAQLEKIVERWLPLTTG